METCFWKEKKRKNDNLNEKGKKWQYRLKLLAFHRVQNHAGRLIDRDFYPSGAQISALQISWTDLSYTLFMGNETEEVANCWLHFIFFIAVASTSHFINQEKVEEISAHIYEFINKF